MRIEKPEAPLRRGWTTGACATAAVKAAYTALLTGTFPDPVTITLPKGEQPSFALALEEKGEGWARVGIVKDAGDDPDVTHGAMVVVTVRLLKAPLSPSDSSPNKLGERVHFCAPSALLGELSEGLRGGLSQNVTFKAGSGVGIVTKPGLPIAVGEPAINPVPRAMMAAVIAELGGGNVEIEISIPDGAAIAEKTWNPRLGIIGGLSILGTTGIVHPFSCAAWIASIHRGIDVARAMGLHHVAGCTGSTSEDVVRAHYGLPLEAMLDMGDFAGGVLKYLRVHPVPRVTIGGGFGKMVKLAQGAMDLHSGRSQVDFAWLAERVDVSLREKVLIANTAMEVLELAGEGLAQIVAAKALTHIQRVLDGSSGADVIIINRGGKIIAHAN
jgi:cobalt-precorrin-5B (C1)-methyltransferase